MIEAHIFVVDRYEFKTKKLPASFDGAKFLYLVDLHNCHYGRYNNKLKASIEKEDPDYVLIGGDFLSKNDDSYDSAIDLLTWLASRYPVYFANGNHESKMKLYPEEYDNIYQEFYHMSVKAGVKHLSNVIAYIKRGDDVIALDGLEVSLDHYGRVNRVELENKDIINAIGKRNPKHMHIMLAHSPNYLKAYSEWGADLVLSGHNHGGIARIPGVCGVLSTEAVLFPKYTKGFYSMNDTKMLVSAGIGGHTIKARFFNPPEILMITMKKDNDNGT
ncbi:MAG: metallophosphoesterase [Lachnospiraceae bacterium]|nr:metallophosphoesterase [Lachnospiraceae bacterium]